MASRIVPIVLILATAGFLTWLSLSMSASGVGATERITIAGETFELTVAADDASRTRGLGGVEHIEPDGGMLFIFPDADYRSFLMRDCQVDIDIIFLSATGSVTALHEMKAEQLRRDNESLREYEARLTKYPSVRRAQYAIELKAGTIDRLGVKAGDQIDIDYMRLKDAAR